MSFIKKILKTGSSQKAKEQVNKQIEKQQQLQKLPKKLVLAQSDPDPTLDLSSSGLDRLDLPAIFTLAKVHFKRKLNFSTNFISAFEPLQQLCQSFQLVTVIHLEENQIQHFRLAAHHSLPTLKELYLSSNNLSTFDISSIELSLPILKVLSLRNNCLESFPLSVILSRSLTFVDLSHNRLSELPKLIASGRNIALSLETLIVFEGNNIENIPFKNLALLGEVDSYTLIRQTVAEIYGINIVNDEDSYLSYSDISNNFLIKNCQNKNQEDEDCFNDRLNFRIGAYEHQKNRARELALEFERNSIKIFHNTKSEVVSEFGSSHLSEKIDSKQRNKCENKTCTNSEKNCVSNKFAINKKNQTFESTVLDCSRDKLLVALAEKEDELSERIHHFQAKKDVAKRALLDDYIRQLQEEFHRKFTQINNLTILNYSKKFQEDDYEEKNILKNALEAYTDCLKSKHDSMLKYLVSSENEDRQALRDNSSAKQVKSGLLIAELVEQDAELAKTLKKWQSFRCARNASYLDKIQIIEEQLLALSFLERTRKSDASEMTLASLASQRSQFASMLRNLLEEKHAKDKCLMISLEHEFQKRFLQEFGDDFSWIKQFQGFLGNESFEIQLEHYDFDPRMADFLRFAYENLDDSLSSVLLYRLANFVDLRFVPKSFQTHELLKIGIKDAEFCAKLTDLFVQHSNKLSEYPAPSAPSIENDFESGEIGAVEPNQNVNTSTEFAITSITETSSLRMTTTLQLEIPEVKLHSESSKIWCESECVICLDSLASILFLPCGHVCTCLRCIRRTAWTLDQCPLCRMNIDLMQPVHRSSTVLEFFRK